METKETPIPLPALEETLTVSDALDFHYLHNPEEPIYVFNKESGSKEPTCVNFRDFVTACHRAAQSTRPGRLDDIDGQVVGLLLVTDTLQYHSTMLGVMRAGLVPFPISHRLTPEAIVHLLKTSSVHSLVATPTTLPTGLLDGITERFNAQKSEHDLHIREMPTLAHLYPNLGTASSTNEHFNTYPAPSKPPSPNDIALYVHSSGSTGMPKAIAHTHKSLVTQASAVLPDMRIPSYRARYSSMGLPPFHTFGLYTSALLPAFHGVSTSIFPPVDTAAGVLPLVPNPKVVLDHTMGTKSNGLIAVPAFLHAWVHEEEDVRKLASLDFVWFGGGNLSRNLGDSLVAAGVNLRSNYGSTELGAISRIFTRRRLEHGWEWLEICEHLNPRWESQGDGTYEFQSMASDKYEPPVVNRSDVRGFATSDLFVRHPTNEKLWKIVGRLDDLIIHSSGEKTAPGPMEGTVLGCPLISGVVMFGRGHDFPGILIELRTEYHCDVNDGVASNRLFERLWPYIEEANNIAPSYSRIFREMILFATPEKPLPRSPKGTVVRKMALHIYSDEIEAIYNRVSSSAQAQADVCPPSNWGAETIEPWLVMQLGQVHGGKNLIVDKDLFEQGCDSLTVTFLSSRIQAALTVTTRPITRNEISSQTVYAYPTIRKLAQYLSTLTCHHQPEMSTDSGEHVASMDAMIERYSEGLGSAVLLTGSTGHLGSELLTALLVDPNVYCVYAFNRPGSQDILQRQMDRFRLWGLDPQILGSHKLRFVEGDLSESNLGISEDLYSEIQRLVSIIFHTSWKVDFNLTLPSFEPQIRGVRNLIDLARNGPHTTKLKFLFTSSVASAQSWDVSQGPYPEKVVRESSYAVGTGYGESKYVAERILERSGLNACSIRIGQLSGNSLTGAWGVNEWFPSLVKSSIALGALPSTPDTASWLSIDAAARSIVDLAFAKDNVPFAVNLAHSRPVPWNSIIESVQNALVDELGLEKYRIPIVPLSDWIERLSMKANKSTSQDFELLPALKLLDFFRAIGNSNETPKSAKTRNTEFGATPLMVHNAVTLSPTLRTASSSQEHGALWVRYWNELGFLC